MSSKKRAVIFANGILTHSHRAPFSIRPDDILIAADGGIRHCETLGTPPHIVIGDFDSLSPSELAYLQTAGAETIRHPAQKDETDLELACQYARNLGVEEILILGALGARWDMTLANLLLPVHSAFRNLFIRLVDGHQEITLAHGGTTIKLHGQPGDTVSLIPLGGDASGISTHGLAYTLNNGTLHFGSPRGVSNVLLGATATITIDAGILLCVVIHKSESTAFEPKSEISNEP